MSKKINATNSINFPMKLVTDEQLSSISVRVALYLASNGKGFNAKNAEVRRIFNIRTPHTMSKVWAELLKSGWLKRDRNQDQSYNYTIRSRPVKPKANKKN